MNARVTLTGFEELRRDIHAAPEEVRAEARDIVRATTEAALAEVKGVYREHAVTGTLAARVRASYPSTDALVGVIRSTAPHSHLFEWGAPTKTPPPRRHRKTGKSVGVSPGHDVIVPIATRHRERMETRLMALLANRGFLVSRT